MTGAALALAARIVLAAVLAASAAAKLRSRAAVQREVGVLVSGRFAPVIAPVLPAAELFVAAALVGWWSPVPGLVALALLAGFTVVLVRAVVRHVPCLCFGSSGLDPPAGPASVLRNGVLAGLAVTAVGDPSGAGAAAAIAWCAGLGAVVVVAVRAAGGPLRAGPR